MRLRWPLLPGRDTPSSRPTLQRGCFWSGQRCFEQESRGRGAAESLTLIPVGVGYIAAVAASSPGFRALVRVEGRLSVSWAHTATLRMLKVRRVLLVAAPPSPSSGPGWWQVDL